MARLGDIGKIITGNTPKTSEIENYSSNDICFIKPSDILESDITYVKDSEFYISELARDKARILPPQSILVTCIGIIGKVAINQVECAFNQQINAIIPNLNTCVPNYLAYAIQYKKNEIQGIANAAVVPILNKTQFSDIEVNLPQLDEQLKIAAVLDKLTNLISLRKQQLAKLDELVKVRFVEMFGEYDISNIQDSWKMISEIGTIIGGATPKTGVEEYWNGEYRWITPAELENDSGYIYDSVRKLTKAGVKSCSLQKLPKGTVVLSSRAPIGKLAIAGESFYCNQGFKNILCGESVLPWYLYVILLFNTDYLNSLGHGATFKEISKSVVENIKIPVPELKLQEEFSKFVEQTHRQKLTIQQSLDKLEVLRKSLMQEYFG